MMQEMRQAISRNALVLSAFAIGTAALLAITHSATLEQIRCNENAALRTSLNAVMPPQRHDNALLADYTTVNDPRLGRGPHRIYRARLQQQATGLVLQSTAPDGYGGAIRLLIGVYTDGRIAGVRMIPPHNETPGLGDNIDIRKSDWIRSFDGRSLANPEATGWAVKKDGGIFDAFTGATITPRAVVAAVQRTLQYVQDEQAQLFAREAEAVSEDSCHD